MEENKLDFVPGTGMSFYQSDEVFKYGLDSLILSSFARYGKRLLDLGSGSGILSFRCLPRFGEITAVENNMAAFKLLEKNIDINNVKNIFAKNISALDLKSYGNFFDTCICNPPYFNFKNIKRNSYAKNAENILDFLDIAKHTLRDRGEFLAIYPTEKLASIVYELELRNLRVKNIIFIKNKSKINSKRAVFRAVKNGGKNVLIRDLVLDDENLSKIYKNEVLYDLLLPNSNR